MNLIFIRLTEDEFEARFPLLRNPLNPQASWTEGEGAGCLFETYGEELEFVRRHDPRCVWTFVDGDDGQLVVQSGYHIVNRIGYLISHNPVPDNQSIEVRIALDCDEDLGDVRDEP